MQPNPSYFFKFDNDIFFKYLFGGNDNKSKYLRKLFVKYVFNINIKDSVVINTEKIPDKYQEKKVILDVLFFDDKKRIYDIEMQVGRFSENVSRRFQYYESRLQSSALLSGDDYKQLPLVYQIILIDDSSTNEDKLITHNCSVELEKRRITQGSIHNVGYVYLRSVKKR